MSGLIAFHPRHLVVVVAMLASTMTLDAGDRPLSFHELMKFRQIRDASISTASVTSWNTTVTANSMMPSAING